MRSSNAGGWGGVLCWSELKFFSMSSVRSPSSVGYGGGGYSVFQHRIPPILWDFDNIFLPLDQALHYRLSLILRMWRLKLRVLHEEVCTQ